MIVVALTARDPSEVQPRDLPTRLVADADTVIVARAGDRKGRVIKDRYGPERVEVAVPSGSSDVTVIRV